MIFLLSLQHQIYISRMNKSPFQVINDLKKQNLLPLLPDERISQIVSIAKRYSIEEISLRYTQKERVCLVALDVMSTQEFPEEEMWQQNCDAMGGFEVKTFIAGNLLQPKDNDGSELSLALRYNSTYKERFNQLSGLDADNIITSMQERENRDSSSVSISDILQIFGNEDNFRLFLICENCARFRKIYENKSKEDSRKMLQGFLAVFRTINTAKSEYIKWKELCKDKVSQIKLRDSLMGNYSEDIPQDVRNQLFLLNLFVSYYIFCDDNGIHIFDTWLKNDCKTPVSTYKIVEEIKKHEYKKDFVWAYKQYIDNLGSDQDSPIPFSLLEDCMPDLKEDTDKDHKDWFEAIPKAKLKSDLMSRYNALRELCCRLKVEDFIQKETDESMFIYRFSGILPSVHLPKDGQRYIQWTGKKTCLACMLNTMYRTNNDIPPYKKLISFFFSKDINAASLVKNANGDVQVKMNSILKDCGFSIG